MPEDTIGRYRRLVREGEIGDDDAQRAAVEKLQMIHRRSLAQRRGGLRSLFRRETPGTCGLYLYGDVGRGKSMLMDLFYATAPLEDRRRVHFHAFMQEIHASIRAARARRVDSPVQDAAARIAAKARLLCFDEFQVEDIADAMILGQLFEALFAAGVIVVVTSNVPPNRLYLHGLNRDLFLPFVALIEERMDLHHLEGPRDYRLEGKGSDRYFAPLGAPADAAMETAWQRAVVGRACKPRTLHVQGRNVLVPLACSRLGRAQFVTLCGEPRGPGDYLAIASAFDRFFLDRIPRLAPADRNEAKRFMTLVDSLYELRRILVCSADGEPESLYPEGDGASAFRRTASRLHEMRSMEWGRSVT